MKLVIGTRLLKKKYVILKTENGCIQVLLEYLRTSFGGRWRKKNKATKTQLLSSAARKLDDNRQQRGL